MLMNWFGGWMLRVADLGSRFALQLVGVGVASALALSVPSAGHVVDHTNAAVTRAGDAAARVAPDLMHNGVRVADISVVKTVTRLNPGPIDSWYPMDTVRQAVKGVPDVVTRGAQALRSDSPTRCCR